MTLTHGFNVPGRVVHRIVGPLTSTACGTTCDYRTGPPQLDVYEAWVTGWRPCFRCYPEFDRKLWDELHERGIEESGYDEIWREIYRRRSVS